MSRFKDIGILMQKPNQRAETCLYYNGTALTRNDNDFNFGAAAEKSYTIAGWCMTTAWGGSAPNRYNEIFVALGTATWRSFFRLYETASTTKSHYWFNVAGGNYMYITYPTSGNNFDINTWYFMSVTFNDTANTLGLYVYKNDGTIAMSGSSASWTATPYNESNIKFRLTWGNYSQKFNSTGIWNRALTLSELQGLMNGGKGKKYVNLTSTEKTNLLAWYEGDNYNSGDGTTTDSSGNGKTLTAGDKTKVSLVSI